MEDIFVKSAIRGQRLTQKQKDANDKQWYKEQADLLDNHSFTDQHIRSVNDGSLANNVESGIFSSISTYKKKKVNYDLFNNHLNMNDLAYVCRPFGAEGGELPANMTNRDIVSPKIKVLLGMEMKMPFSWKVIATNEEATTRKETEEFERIKQFVTNEIMNPIRMQIEQQQAEQTKGKKLTPEEQQQLQQQIQEELQSQTPDEVKKYMTREHQDPAEVMMKQILEYLIEEQRVKDKFNRGFKHSLLGGREIYHIGIFNGKPGMRVINDLRFDHDASEDVEGIEDGEWAVCEYRMTPSEIVSKFGSELSETDIDNIYSYSHNPGSAIQSADFTFDDNVPNDAYTIKALHLTWKSLMKIGFLEYNSIETGKPELMLVDENYKLNKEYGDISIQWEWIPETHEVWKIMSDIYVYGRPVPGQHKDLDNLWEAKLPYYGAACDSMNSIVTSAMDRIKAYQYYYNIILYRIELLMASDKGKILALNINAIPKSAGIDINKFIYFMEANKLAIFNPAEEGNRGGQGGDVTNLVKEIDMSLASDIQKYINMAEYIETKCGAAIGVTKAMEGAIGPTDAVTNTKQNLVQASHIVQPYFELHNIVKGKVLKALVETAKVAYSESPPKSLSYVLDDMSVKMLTIDSMLLDSSVYGLFISNSGKADEAKQAIIQLSQAAMQNQQIDILDVIKIIKSDDMNAAEEQLEVGMQNKQDQAQAMDKQKMDQDKAMQDQQMGITREQWAHEEKMILLKASEDRKTKLQVEAMAALGFDPNKDEDGDGEPDILEVYKHGLDVEIKKGKLEQDQQKLGLEKDKFAHQKMVDYEKLKNDNKKIEVSKNKLNSK